MVFDFTQIEHVSEARRQCKNIIAEEIRYLETSIIPELNNYIDLDKDSQRWIMKEVISFTSNLNHILIQTHELDINKSNMHITQLE